MSVWQAITRAVEAGDPTLLVEQIPYAKTLGIEMLLEQGELMGKMEFKDALVGNPKLPAIHGGILGGLLESTAIFTLLWKSRVETVPKTINLTVEYLRSGRPQTTYSRATITRHGRLVANVHAVAWQDEPERPIAAAHAHFLLAPVE